ncbi:hypothetical protein ABW19_dt0205395 [Dactylella cylindrospora]|nr:hypothetical protein ABW19_dt0205395 [Dactylella cylindrospora]
MTFFVSSPALLCVSVDDLTTDALEDAISSSPTLSQLILSGHRILTHSCQSIRLAQDSRQFLPLWGNITSTALKSIILTDLQPSCRIYLDRYSIPGSVEIWNIINHCPNLKHLDIRVRLSARDNRNNYINDFAGRDASLRSGSSRSRAGNAGRSDPVVHLETLRLQNCTLSAFEFNRLDPEGIEELHIPYNGRKRLFRDLGSNSNLGAGNAGYPVMVFPKNLKSLVVDSLPLAPDRKEPWQEVFDRHFAELRLEELVVLTRKADFWVQSTMNSYSAAMTGGIGGWVSRSGEDLSPNTRNVAVAMITGEKWNGSNSPGGTAASFTDTPPPNSEGGVDIEESGELDIGRGMRAALGMGSWLKRLLLKGSWTMTRSLLDSLLVTCWGLEEFGVALLWRDWVRNLNQ